MRDLILRMVIRHFDTHTKKEYDLEKTIQARGVIDNEDEQEMGKGPSLQMTDQLLQTKTVYFYLMPLMLFGVST